MALISVTDVSVGFGGPLLLDRVHLQIERGERVCLVGRNGAGKSTLMRLIGGDIVPDEGEVVRSQGVRIALLPQEIPHDLFGATSDVVAAGLDDSTLPPAAGWRKTLQVEKVLSRMGLDPEARFEDLSAGLKRRVLLARGLARDPDLLLLDEPTNHLDMEAIGWMEELLLRFGGTLVFVTHDRVFLQKLATRIVEIDRGRLIDWACDYATFLKRKEAALEVEAEQWVQFDKKLAREEAWIRQGVKARRTRNEGRARALERLREARQERRERMGTVRLRAQEAARSGKLVIEAQSVGFGYDPNVPVIRDLSTVIMRGDKVGIMGPNGSGKTTLLRLLLGELQPREGTVRRGVGLQAAYFDQLRAQLDEDRSVQENIGQGNDTILLNGRALHVMSYLRNFLFSPERARSPVKTLSGGERNRLLLALLFTKPANLLVLDEPTNDLDTETLELLEELLLDYPGTVLLVSHDRAFLNNVVSSSLVLEGEGRVGEYVGGYDDWLRQRKPLAPTALDKPVERVEKPRSERVRAPSLSYREKQELEALPSHIEALEAEQASLYEAMGDPSFYQRQGAEIAGAKARLDAIGRELEAAYERWEALEALNHG
jgi:ATP-binding cassette subfamily F protein uup